MYIWLMVILPSAVFGGLCAQFIRRKWAVLVAGLVPWSGLLCVLLYSVYLVPTERMDASMWPIALFFGGNVAAFAGVMTYMFCKYLIGLKTKN